MQNKEHIISFEPGKSEIVEAVIMNISTSYFRNKILFNRDSAHLSMINMQTEDVGCTLEKYNGTLLCVTKSGIAAMFEGNYNNALQFAVTLCQDAELEERRKLFKGLAIGIDYGTLCIGAVGYNDLNMPLLMSETMDTAINLSEIADKYNSRILITEDAVSRMSDIRKQYNIRRLGKIFHTATDTSEELYDLYDGDLADTKYSKMRSRLFFETGVDLFQKGSYLEARSYFIEILKAYRNDATAKQYVFRCDNCIAGTAGENEKQYLEVW